MAKKEGLPAQPNNSLIAGLECLQQVAASGSIGSRELSRQMGLTHTRANRLLGTLAFMGLIEREEDRRYRPGPALHVLAASSAMASRLLPSALPTLVRLNERGYTVALGTLWRGKVCYLFHERPGQTVAESILQHELWPADYSSVGIALLAAMDADPADHGLPTFGFENTLLPGQDVFGAVAFARSHNYSVLRFKDEITSIGVAIGSPPLAGLAVSGRHIGESSVPVIAQDLTREAELITAKMKAERPPRAGLRDESS